MSGFGTLLRKEFTSLFSGALAWALIAVFLLLMGYTFSAWLLVGRNASLLRTVHQAAVLLLLFVPLLTMRTFAEERRQGTLALILASPVSDSAVVAAKYCACLGMVGCMLAPTLLYPVLLAILGSPDWGSVIGGYLGLMLLASALVATGMCTSSLTSNQIVAATVSLGANLLLWVLGTLGSQLPDPYDVLVVNMALLAHFTPFSLGLLYLSDLAYFLTLTGFFLFLCKRALRAPW